uniref:Uncharacterized protein n=1 Tax=Anguilla anguilla TaxID=7936 RepID=A0A0E9U3J8_ANGAN
MLSGMHTEKEVLCVQEPVQRGNVQADKSAVLHV